MSAHAQHSYAHAERETIAAMGQTSSQLEQPTQAPANMLADEVTSPSRKRKTSDVSLTASEILRRDLEESILDNNDDAEPKPKKRKRRKVEEIRSEDIEAEQPLQTRISTPDADFENAVPPTPPKARPSKRRTKEEKDLANAIWAEKEAEKARDRLKNEVKVYNNEGQWRSLPNGKYGVKLYKKGEAPSRSAVETKEADESLKRVTKDIENADQAIENATKLVEDCRERLETVRAGVGATVAQPDAEPEALDDQERQDEDASKVAERPAQKRRRKQTSAAAEPPDEPEKPTKRKKRASKAKDENGEPLVEPETEPGSEYPEHIYRYKPRIDNWLEGQEETRIVDARDLESIQEATAAKKVRRDKKQEKKESNRRRPRGDTPTPSNSFEPPTVAGSPAPQAATGPFTKEERDIADRVFADVMRENDLSDAQLRAMIQDYRQAGIFKTKLEAALPRRSKDALRKFCKRRYHLQERGPWTAEQDEALKDSVAKWPNEWTKISGVVGRTADDCKDRWRKQLQYGDKKEVGPWSDEEQTMLISGITKNFDKILADNPALQGRGQQQIIAIINWESVAKHLEGRRSAKQCREKAHKLMGPAAFDGMKGWKGSEKPKKKPRKSEVSKRQVTAQKHLEQCEVGDYYDLFTEIHTAFADHNVHFSDQDNSVWSKVAWMHQGSRFNVSRCGGALRRLAYETAIKDWPRDSKNKNFQRRLEKADTIPAKALVLANYIEKKAEGRELPRTYRTDLLMKTKEEVMKIVHDRLIKFREQQLAKVKKEKSSDLLSKDVIDDSEGVDEDEVAEALKEPDPVAEEEPVDEGVEIDDDVVMEDGEPADNSDVNDDDDDADEEENADDPTPNNEAVASDNEGENPAKARGYEPPTVETEDESNDDAPARPKQEPAAESVDESGNASVDEEDEIARAKQQSPDESEDESEDASDEDEAEITAPKQQQSPDDTDESEDSDDDADEDDSLPPKQQESPADTEDESEDDSEDASSEGDDPPVAPRQEPSPSTSDDEPEESDDDEEDDDDDSKPSTAPLQTPAQTSIESGRDASLSPVAFKQRSATPRSRQKVYGKQQSARKRL